MSNRRSQIYFLSVKKATYLEESMCDKRLALTLEALREVEEIKRFLGLGGSADSGGREGTPAPTLIKPLSNT